MIKKEVFGWLKEGKKTIDVRKGAARRGDIAVFQSGANCIRLAIAKRETGKLIEVVRPDNYKQIIPLAESLEGAIEYLNNLYGVNGELYTAYYLGIPKNNSV